jgi:dihydrofolate synthase / folylpolyglutamate synthase
MDAQTLPQTLHAESEVDRAYHEALDWLLSFATFQHKTQDAYEASKLHLERMHAILARLGNPHRKFPSVHIAGTKGKGSTAAMCESILRAAGYKTGLYTSPHLHTFRERVRVDGEPISRDAVVAGITRLRAIQPDFPDTIVFEWISALAFDYFARAGIEFGIVEVGLGGRLDATNVITPRVSIISSISYDHMHVLGNSLAQIAREKAGIIKPGIPVVSSPQTDEARAMIERTAKERGAELVQINSKLEFEISGSKFQVVPFRSDLESQELKFKDNDAKPVTWNLKLLGAHQAQNAATAIAAMKRIGISNDVIRAGIENARWPGRFEILERNPYVIVDGAHNGDSARQLVATLDSLLPRARVHWIFGAGKDHDSLSMFAELRRRSSAIILTRSPHPRADDPHELAKLAEESSFTTAVTPTVGEALRLARSRLDGYDAIVVTGSLFVVAEARGLVLREHGERVESDE